MNNEKENKIDNNTKEKIMKKMLPFFYVFLIVCIVGIFCYEYIDPNVENIEKINVENLSVNLKYGQTHQIELNSKNNENYNIKWESSDPSLVSVDNNGKLTVNNNQDGKVIIKAITEEQKVLANITVEISKIETIINVSGVKLDKNELELKYGETTRLTATISPLDATNKEVIWESNNPNLVSVDSDGNIITNVNQTGEAIITVKTVDGNYIDSANVKVTYVDQTVKVESIKLNKKSLTIKYGETQRLVATISPSDATNKEVIWESNNPNLVSVDSDGNIITNVNQTGEAIVTVKTVDGNYIDSANVVIEAVTKEKKVTGIKLNKSKVTLKYGEKTNIVATISPSNATNKSLTWTSSDPSLVSVDSNGNIKAVGNKNATITITAKTVDGGYAKTVIVTLKSIKVTGVKLNETSMTLRYGQTTNLIANIFPSNAANKSITWISSDPNVATVSSDGKVTAVDGGTAVITAITNDGSFKANCTITVERKKYTVKFDSNGGSSIAIQSVLEGNQAKEPDTPTKLGYIFNGWFINNSKYNFTTNVNSNITLTASWITDYNVVDYCSNMPISYEKDGVVLRKCIKDFVISTIGKQKNRFMQNFSITSNYIYFSSPLSGAYTTNYSESDLKDSKKYNEIVDSEVFEAISTVYIKRIDKSTGAAKQMQIKYSGHGQGFDTISGDKDLLYLTAIAHPMYLSKKIGVGSSGISYTTFKEEEGTRVPGTTFVFNSNGAVAEKILTSNFMQDGVFNSTLYFNKIKEYAKNSSMLKQILSMAIDEKNNKLVYSIGKKTYIYSLSAVKAGTATGPIKQFNTVSNQGLELNGTNLYVTTNSGSIIGIHKYNISTGAKIKTVEMDLGNLYKTRIEKGNVIESEGLSIYNGQLYIGIISREDGTAYNDIYLVEGF